MTSAEQRPIDPGGPELGRGTPGRGPMATPVPLWAVPFVGCGLMVLICVPVTGVLVAAFLVVSDS